MVKDSESGQMEIPKELNDSNNGGKGLPTDAYSANINSKRELVSQTEKKPSNIADLATKKDKSAKSEQQKAIDPAEIEMQIGDDEEESESPQQVHMVESEEESDEDPVPASNISKKEVSRGSASAQMQNLSGQNISANL